MSEQLSVGKNQTIMICKVGDTVRLTRPLYYKGLDLGMDPKEGEHGFRIVYPKLGEFIAWSDDEAGTWVEYKHLRSGTQVIEFYSNVLGSHTFSCVIQGITVHDHASIAMGGPAFATYYTEQTATPTEET